LENGLIITGQSQISHPSTSQEYPPPIHKTRPPTPSDDALRTNYFTDAGVPINEVEISKHQHQQRRVSLESSVSTFSDSDEEESGNVPQYTHPELKKSQLHFNKLESIEPLLSPIKRIFYVSPYGEEICPTANGRVTSTIANSDTLIYSIGSLMTSIAPVLVLKGVGKAITTGKCKNKILLLNGCLDRETFGMTAYDFVKVIVESTEYSLRNQNMNSEQLPWNKVVTHLIYMSDLKIDVDVELLNSRGVACVEVSKIENTDYFDLGQLEQTLADII